jgi:RNA polymerase sigma-70 factor (ECF subfamily)
MNATEEATFSAEVERHRRELQVHCYRMLGSFEESEDAVQETFLRAWRKRDTYQGRSSFRAWLYAIATNTCLDALKRRPRVEPGAEISWLQPFPDHLLDEVAPAEDEPDAAVVAKETVELAYLVAIQYLPVRQRAVLILRDVLGWPAREVASLLETSEASVNSALQRARAGLKEHLPERRLEWKPGADPSDQERELLNRYVEATEQADIDGLTEVLHEDLRFSMPPDPGVWEGRDEVVSAWVSGGFGSEDFGEFRCTITYANRQPAVVNYARKPGESEHRLFALDVMRIEAGQVIEIITFSGDALAPFDLPQTL